MTKFLSVFIFFAFAIWGIDYDYIVVGSSPFSLFEALYQCHLGNRVLILEKEEGCGGAWRGIPICGIPYVDLGCHQIGRDLQLKAFLEMYAGCKIVSLDNPKEPSAKGGGANGWYFSRGCYELIDHLLKLISKTDIALLTRTKVENILIHESHKEATVQTKEASYTTSKIILTPMSQLRVYREPLGLVNLDSARQSQIEALRSDRRDPAPSGQGEEEDRFGEVAASPNSPNLTVRGISGANESLPYPTSKYYHLYLFIQDPTPPRFHYRSRVGKGSSRMMNLTPFVDLEGTGRQLIVIQTIDEAHLAKGGDFLEMMKEQSLISKGAYILESESYIYESGSFHPGVISKVGAEEIIEVLQTGHFQQLTTYIPKWEKVLKPYSEFFTN